MPQRVASSAPLRRILLLASSIPLPLLLKLDVFGSKVSRDARQPVDDRIEGEAVMEEDEGEIKDSTDARSTGRFFDVCEDDQASEIGRAHV